MTDALRRSRPVPGCPVCDWAGRPLHRDVKDMVWGAPGAWTFVRCNDAECGTVWLDPAPLEEDMGMYYARYQTHDGAATPQGPPWLARAKRGYLAMHRGYPPVELKGWERVLAAAIRWMPQQRARLEAGTGFLRGEQRGKVLDLGCGAGDTLLRLRELGWEVTGVDTDPAAVAAARGRGLDVLEGTLASRHFPDGCFDAILMSHVVEHLHDPRSVLAECRRVLSPGGRLVLETPNAWAWFLAWLGPYWRGLEPPRHIQIFTPASLTRLVSDCGFQVERVIATPKAAAFSFSASLAALAAHRTGRCSQDAIAPPLRALGTAAAALEVALGVWSPDRGEEVVLVARRAGGDS